MVFTEKFNSPVYQNVFAQMESEIFSAEYSLDPNSRKLPETDFESLMNTVQVWADQTKKS